MCQSLRCTAADGLSSSEEDHFLLFWGSGLWGPLCDLSKPGPEPIREERAATGRKRLQG